MKENTLIVDDENVKIIIRQVCKFFGVTDQELRSSSRERRLTEPRQAAFYYMRKYTRKGTQEIGRVFNRDHATVLHACRTVETLMDIDKFGHEVKRIDAHIKFHLRAMKYTLKHGYVKYHSYEIP